MFPFYTRAHTFKKKQNKKNKIAPIIRDVVITRRIVTIQRRDGHVHEIFYSGIVCSHSLGFGTILHQDIWDLLHQEGVWKYWDRQKCESRRCAFFILRPLKILRRLQLCCRCLLEFPLAIIPGVRSGVVTRLVHARSPPSPDWNFLSRDVGKALSSYRSKGLHQIFFFVFYIMKNDGKEAYGA